MESKMTHQFMEEIIDEFTNEYFRTGKYEYPNGEDGLNRRTAEEEEELWNRILKFFDINDVPVYLQRKFAKTGIGSSPYMAYGLKDIK